MHYVLDGSTIVSETRKDGYDTVTHRFYYYYDENGSPVGLNWNGQDYYYYKNIFGDVLGIFNSSGTLVVRYAYDAWGSHVSITGSMANTLGQYNPFRYRGYYYDTESGMYYLNARYYKPSWCRFISAEPNLYKGGFDSGAGFVKYNVFAYCANNPVNFSDPNGEFLLTALIVGIVAGATVGGAIGGTVAYKSAKSAGIGGSDLFWATLGGAGKGALIGGVAGGLVGATGSVVVAHEVASIAGTAIITTTATIAAKTIEVSALQAKKSLNDEDNGWQIANDCIDSVFSNGGKIISPALTKAGTTYATYIATDFIKHKVVPLDFNSFLWSTGGKVLPYSFTAYAWGHTTYSIFCTDPIARANQRGYCLN